MEQPLGGFLSFRDATPLNGRGNLKEPIKLTRHSGGYQRVKHAPKAVYIPDEDTRFPFFKLKRL